MKVKICGIRTVEAALAAFDAGADFLGFNFVPSSKRYIIPGEAKKIIQAIRNYSSSEALAESRSSRQARTVKIVGVFQNAKLSDVNSIAREVGLNLVQLHGKEDNKYISQMNKPVIKSFTVFDNPETIQAKYLMLDRVAQGKGEMVDLEKAKAYARTFPLFLAGGLTPENVSEIVRVVKPYAVDVASGVETNGTQDLEKIRLFGQKAKEFFQ